jgi:hypothetical protein
MLGHAISSGSRVVAAIDFCPQLSSIIGANFAYLDWFTADDVGADQPVVLNVDDHDFVDSSVGEPLLCLRSQSTSPTSLLTIPDFDDEPRGWVGWPSLCNRCRVGVFEEPALIGLLILFAFHRVMED